MKLIPIIMTIIIIIIIITIKNSNEVIKQALKEFNHLPLTQSPLFVGRYNNYLASYNISIN